MTPDTSTTLQELMQGCAQYLRTSSVNRTGMLFAPASPGDRTRLRAPPLRTPLMLGSIALADLPRLLYADPPVSAGAVKGAWSRLAKMALEDLRTPAPAVLEVVQPLFPSLPFTRPLKSDMRAEMVQFLQAAAWQAGTLRVNGFVQLTIDGSRLLLDRQSMEWPGHYRRQKCKTDVRPEHYLDVMLGRWRNAVSARVGGLYHHLLRILPELSAQTTLVFQTASWAGADFERLLVSAFDVQVSEGEAVASKVPWEKLLRIIDKSVKYPTETLAEVLMPVMGRTSFEKVFGHLGMSDSLYPAHVRQRHRDCIVAMQMKDIDRARRSSSLGQAGALMDLQQMIRSI